MSTNTPRQQFADDFAGTAFQSKDGEQKIVGKFGEIVRLDDGTWDAWFIGPELEPLSEHKLTALEKKARGIGHFRRLTGEAYMQGEGEDFVRQVAPLIGVKKRRRISQQERERLRRQAAKARESIAA